MDAVLTMVPRRAAQVDQLVDVPYAADAIFSVKGNEFGPHLRPMERHLASSAILRGVYAGSVQHNYAGPQLLRMKMGVGSETPSIFEVIAQNLRAHPLGGVALGREEGFQAPGLLSCIGPPPSLCDVLAATPREQLELAAAGLGTLSASSDASPEISFTSRSMSDFLARAAQVPPPRTEVWFPETKPEERIHSHDFPQNALFQRDCQRAIWLLENELATGVSIFPIQMDWDSHTANLTQQTYMNGAFWPIVARFLDELEVRRNRHGSLASQTMVVVSSELGRLPRLNDQLGKDHFPEMPMMFFGPGINTGKGEGAVFGGVGRRMESLAVDRKTGRVDASGKVPDLNDVGATVLSAFGVSPRVYGYTGHRLDFLLEADA